LIGFGLSIGWYTGEDTKDAIDDWRARRASAKRAGR